MKFGTRLKGDVLQIYVEHEFDDGDESERIYFEHKFESEALADIVDDAISNGLDGRIKMIRETAYNRGRADTMSVPAASIVYFEPCINEDGVDAYDDE